MKKLLNMLPLIIIFALCISIISCSAFSMFTVAQSDTVSTVDAGALPLKEYKLFHSQPTQSQNTSSAIQVSASSSDALGKIHEQFLSPYGASLKYSGIYIKNSTGLKMDLKKELAEGIKIKISKSSKPQVLIVHTHTTESYMTEDRNYYTASDKSRSTDNTKNMVQVGEHMAKILRDGGIGVIHDTTQHDHPSYNGSYSRARKTINEYLKENPSIKVVVDLHRDSIAMDGNDKCKPVAQINGKKAAQVMLVVGSETGTVKNFPNWRENFRLAIRFQQTMEAMYPGLPRAILFASRKYNMDITTGSMLLEIGTDSNTLEEACYSAELAGKALLSLLNTLK